MAVERPVDWQSRLAALAALTVTFALLFRFEREQGRLPARSDGTEASDRSDHSTALALARASEPGRGRNARSPREIPWQGWKDIFARVYGQTQQNRLLAVAGGVVFFSLLAMVPAITAFVSLYGLFAGTGTIAEHLSFAASMMPVTAYELVRDQVIRIVGKGDGKLTLAFAAGLAAAIWSANAGIKALMDGLNVVYGENEKRSFLHLNMTSLTFTAGAIAMLLLAIGVVIVFPIALALFGLGTMQETVIAVVRWPAVFLIVIIGLAVLYRHGPSRRQPRWRWVSVGSAVGALAWLAASLLFSWYLSNFGNYDAAYGSLGAVIGLMMWMWLSVIAVLMGAQLDAEIEHQTARDSTVGPDKPLGLRGAVMADTVGAAR
jgi:membrane protein